MQEKITRFDLSWARSQIKNRNRALEQLRGLEPEWAANNGTLAKYHHATARVANGMQSAIYAIEERDNALEAAWAYLVKRPYRNLEIKLLINAIGNLLGKDVEPLSMSEQIQYDLLHAPPIPSVGFDVLFQKKAKQYDGDRFQRPPTWDEDRFIDRNSQPVKPMSQRFYGDERDHVADAEAYSTYQAQQHGAADEPNQGQTVRVTLTDSNGNTETFDLPITQEDGWNTIAVPKMKGGMIRLSMPSASAEISGAGALMISIGHKDDGSPDLFVSQDEGLTWQALETLLTGKAGSWNFSAHAIKLGDLPLTPTPPLPAPWWTVPMQGDPLKFEAHSEDGQIAYGTLDLNTGDVTWDVVQTESPAAEPPPPPPPPVESESPTEPPDEFFIRQQELPSIHKIAENEIPITHHPAMRQREQSHWGSRGWEGWGWNQPSEGWYTPPPMWADAAAVEIPLEQQYEMSDPHTAKWMIELRQRQRSAERLQNILDMLQSEYGEWSTLQWDGEIDGDPQTMGQYDEKQEITDWVLEIGSRLAFHRMQIEGLFAKLNQRRDLLKLMTATSSLYSQPGLSDER